MDTTTRSVNRVFAEGDRVTVHDPDWWLHGRVGTVVSVTRGGHPRVKIDDPQDEHLIVQGSPLFFLPEA